MSKFDHFDIDGRLLRLLVAVYEESSITRAALRLGVTQSAVSHLLDKLRGIVGDPLFVKSGRTVVATARAAELVEQARGLLDQLRDFGVPSDFDPAQLKMTLTIAANDLQRDWLLPAFFVRLREQAPGVRLRIVPSNIPNVEMLRTDHCQLVISPRPPDAGDIMQQRLFEDRYVVYYDPECCAAPLDLEEYQAAEHVTVIYEPQRRLDIDEFLLRKGIRRRFAVSVTGFAGIGAFLSGSVYFATLPRRLSRRQLAGFAYVAPPFKCPPMPMYAVWHQRYQHDPMHRWVREMLLAVNEQLGMNEMSSPL